MTGTIAESYSYMHIQCVKYEWIHSTKIGASNAIERAFSPSIILSPYIALVNNTNINNYLIKTSVNGVAMTLLTIQYLGIELINPFPLDIPFSDFFFQVVLHFTKCL